MEDDPVAALHIDDGYVCMHYKTKQRVEKNKNFEGNSNFINIAWLYTLKGVSFLLLLISRHDLYN